MSNRLIPYGYFRKNGCVQIDEKEALIVKDIFDRYIQGEFLQQLANRLQYLKIEYNSGQCKWSKRKIARIIENELYLGNEDYPQIIKEDIFIKANSIRQLRFNNRTEPGQEIAKIKANIFCGECGNKLKREIDKTKRERWFCPNKCVKGKRITDTIIYEKIKELIYQTAGNLDSISIDEGRYEFNQTTEIVRYNNEIIKNINSVHPNYSLGKELTLKCLMLKFEQCKENRNIVYSNIVKDTLKNLPKPENFKFSYVEDIIEGIYIMKNIKLKIRFINDFEIIEREEDNGEKRENSYKNSG